MGINVVEVQPTPNPNALKFVLDRSVADQPVSFFSASAAQGHSLAARLFEVDGVASLLLLGDFITVNKHSDATWTHVQRDVRRALSENEWVPNENVSSH